MNRLYLIHSFKQQSSLVVLEASQNPQLIFSKIVRFCDNMATAGAVPKEKRQLVSDGAAGNDSDATVDYNDCNKAKPRVNEKANVAPRGNDAGQKEDEARARDSPYVSDEKEWEDWRVLKESLSSGRRRHRRQADRRSSFMRGYRSANKGRRGSSSSGSEQSEPLDGSDSSGRRVRRRVNCINTLSSSPETNVDDGECTSYDTGE